MHLVNIKEPNLIYFLEKLFNLIVLINNTLNKSSNARDLHNN